MPPFTSAAQTSRNTITSKLARRAEALKHAPAFLADEHQKYLNATGQSTCGAASQRSAFADVGGRTATQIVENIQAKVWTATAVMEAYLARAAQAQDATNCLTEGARSPLPSASLSGAYVYLLCFSQCSLRRLGRKHASWTLNLPRRENSRVHCMVCRLVSRICVRSFCHFMPRTPGY